MSSVRPLDLYALGAVLALVAAIGYWVGQAPDDGAPIYEAPAVTVLAIDRSASVVQPRDRHERWALDRIQEEASAAAERGDDLALLTFDRGVQRRIGPVPASEFFAALRTEAGSWLISLPFDDGPAFDPAYGSDLTGAAEMASEVASDGSEPRPPGTLVVIGDGVSTTPGADEALMSRRFAEVRLVPPEPPERSDVWVHRVRAPRSVEPGVAVQVDVELGLRAGSETPSELALEWTLTSTSVDTIARGRNVAETRTGSVRVDLPGVDADPFAFTRSFVAPALPAGTAQLEVIARLAGSEPHDAFPENSSGSAAWVIGDPIRVLVAVPSDPSLDDAVALFRGREFEGMEFTGATAAQLEARLSVVDPAPYDAVVTMDLPLASLPEDAMAEFIEERGGGWVNVAGWPRLRDEVAGKLDPLLALEPDSEPLEPRDIIVLMDGSGSMKGDRWQRARSALERLLPSIPVRDRIMVRFFTHGLGPVAMSFEGMSGALGRERRAEELEIARRDLRAMQISGGHTSIGASLKGLLDERERARAGGAEIRQGLVLLLTDGISNVPGGPREAERIRARFDELGDSLVAIQIGGGARGSRYLGYLTGDESEVRWAGELKGVLAILQEAIQTSGLAEDALVIRGPAAPDATGPSAGASREVLAAAARQAQEIVLGDEPLVLASLLPCRAREGAAAFLMSEAVLAEEATDEAEAIEGRPSYAVSALAARGRGTVCGLAFVLQDAGGRSWAPDLGRRIEFLGPVLRAMGQRADEAQRNTVEERVPTVTLDGGAITLSGLDRATPATLPVEVVGPSTVNLLGVWERGDVLAEVNLVPPLFSALESRSGDWPRVLDSVPRGTRLVLRPARSGAGAFSPVEFPADGPLEALGGANAPAAAFRARQEARELEPAGDSSPKAREPHPMANWLLLLSAVCTFTGAILGVIGRRRVSAA